MFYHECWKLFRISRSTCNIAWDIKVVFCEYRSHGEVMMEDGALSECM
jgi:hypothetical protein